MRELNQQRAERPSLADTLEVHSIWPTIQGEGPFVGRPAIFVRVAACNLQCPLCDTDYTSRRRRYSPKELLDEVRGLMPSRYIQLVVLTGGEPFRQQLGPHVEVLHNAGFMVQIETNGTMYQDGFPYDRASLICSPKTPSIHGFLHRHISAFKYILRAGYVDSEDGLPSSSLGMPGKPARRKHATAEVFVQPLDEGDERANKLNREAAVDSCLRYGYRLSLQTHKMLGLE